MIRSSHEKGRNHDLVLKLQLSSQFKLRSNFFYKCSIYLSTWVRLLVGVVVVVGGIVGRVVVGRRSVVAVGGIVGGIVGSVVVRRGIIVRSIVGGAVVVAKNAVLLKQVH